MKHIISIRDYSKDDLMRIIDRARSMETERHRYGKLLDGKIIGTLFFEPSTRTRLSFEAAAHRLGASVIGFADPTITSVSKGETLKDTIKILNGYADILVMRHPQAGSAAEAASVSVVPLINGGDGTNEHPTQTMVDLYSIHKNLGKLDGLSIGFVGDLKFGRTVHSLSFALSLFNIKLYFISPDSLRMPGKYLKELDEKKIFYEQTDDLEKIMHQLDVLYVTRVQKERFLDPKDYEHVKGSYVINKAMIAKGKKTLKILHPLPRVDELHHELDDLPQSIYFQQAHNGIPVRMALLSMVSGALK